VQQYGRAADRYASVFQRWSALLRREGITFLHAFAADAMSAVPPEIPNMTKSRVIDVLQNIADRSRCCAASRASRSYTRPVLAWTLAHSSAGNNDPVRH
jgi:hypothetical protein